MNILVTGGAGYIGSHTASLLLEAGHKITIIDNLTTGFRESIPAATTFMEGDIRDSVFLDKVLQSNKFDALIHFAAKLVVPESVIDPQAYYQNNVVGSLNLFSKCVQYKIERIIFSSTAAVYGEPSIHKINESTRCQPINPYGSSKLLAERILLDFAKAYGLKAVILRYFNVAGASINLQNGQKTKNATHLIKVAAEAASRKRESVSVFGTDYSTYDGTCIRDYIHVLDLAAAHVSALEYLQNAGESQVLNCGYGRGFSVLDVLTTMRDVSGVDFKIINTNRRDGDPAAIIADNSKALSILKWVPKYDNLETICKTSFEWEKNL